MQRCSWWLLILFSVDCVFRLVGVRDLILPLIKTLRGRKWSVDWDFVTVQPINSCIKHLYQQSVTGRAVGRTEPNDSLLHNTRVTDFEQRPTLAFLLKVQTWTQVLSYTLNEPETNQKNIWQAACDSEANLHLSFMWSSTLTCEVASTTSSKDVCGWRVRLPKNWLAGFCVPHLLHCPHSGDFNLAAFAFVWLQPNSSTLAACHMLSVNCRRGPDLFYFFQ